MAISLRYLRLSVRSWKSIFPFPFFVYFVWFVVFKWVYFRVVGVFRVLKGEVVLVVLFRHCLLAQYGIAFPTKIDLPFQVIIEAGPLRL